MFGLFKKKASAFEPDALTIVPRIKHTNFLKYLKETGVAEAEMPPMEPLVADLLVTYAFDTPQLFMMAMPHHVKQLGLKPEQLRPLAMDNLRRQIPQIQIEEIVLDGGPRMNRVVTGNGCEACTILAPKFWDDVAPKVNGRLVVAVASRDVVLFCGDGSKADVDAMIELGRVAFQQAGNHGLTHKLLTREEGAWVEYGA